MAPEQVLNRDLADLPALQTPRACDHGDFPFLTRAAFERVDGFDERFQHYFADPDLGFRIQQAGLRNVYCPTSVVVHHELAIRTTMNAGNARLVADRESFARKWVLAPREQWHSSERRPSYLYVDTYLRHLGDERPGEMTDGPVVAVEQLAEWIPDGCRDVVEVGPGSSRGAHEWRSAGRLDVTTVEAPSFLPLGFTACDLIVARHTLSRSCWPAMTLREFNRVLDTGGYVLLTLPPCEDAWIHHPDHHSVLNDAQWRRVFMDTGFVVTRAAVGADSEGQALQQYLLRKVVSVDAPRAVNAA